MKGPFYYPPGLVGLGIALHDVLVAILVNELTLDQVQHIFVVTCSWGELVISAPRTTETLIHQSLRSPEQNTLTDTFVISMLAFSS